jgi:hypothetical protein
MCVRYPQQHCRQKNTGRRLLGRPVCSSNQLSACGLNGDTRRGPSVELRPRHGTAPPARPAALFSMLDHQSTASGAEHDPGDLVNGSRSPGSRGISAQAGIHYRLAPQRTAGTCTYRDTGYSSSRVSQYAKFAYCICEDRLDGGVTIGGGGVCLCPPTSIRPSTNG